MPRYPRTRWANTPAHTLIIEGHGYKATATWTGGNVPSGQPKFRATLEADGYAKQWSWFGPSPMFYIDDANAVAECCLALFGIGRGDVDPEFFIIKKGDDAFHDKRWIREWNADRERLDMDRETFERRRDAARKRRA